MGILSGMGGNMSSVTPADAAKEFQQLLAQDEQVVAAYRLVRDMWIMTNRRLIMIDKQGMSGRKVETHSVPYKAITHFAVESAGSFDLDAELKIWISGRAEPFQQTFSRGVNVYEVQAILAAFVAR